MSKNHRNKNLLLSFLFKKALEKHSEKIGKVSNSDTSQVYNSATINSKELEKDIKKARSMFASATWLVPLLVSVTIIGLILIFLSMLFENKIENSIINLFATYGVSVFIPVMAVLCISALVYSFKGIDSRRNVLTAIINAKIKNPTISWVGNASQSYGKQVLLVPNNMTQTLHVDGEYNDKYVEFENISISPTNKKGESNYAFNSHKCQYYYTELDDKVLSPIRIIAVTGQKSNLFQMQQKNEKRIETESLLFNQEFEIYTNNEIDSYVTLNPMVIEKLIALKKDLGEFAIYANSYSIWCIVHSKEEKLLYSKDIKEINNMTIDSVMGEIERVFNDTLKIGNSLSRSIKPITYD